MGHLKTLALPVLAAGLLLCPAPLQAEGKADAGASVRAQAQAQRGPEAPEQPEMRPDEPNDARAPRKAPEDRVRRRSQDRDPAEDQQEAPTAPRGCPYVPGPIELLV